MVIYAYLILVLLFLFIMLFRKETTLIRGQKFFLFNVVFVLFAVLYIFISEQFTTPRDTVFLGVIILVSYFLRGQWLLFKNDIEKTNSTIENSLKMILLSSQRDNNEHVVKTDKFRAGVDIQAFLFNMALVRFKGDWPTSKIKVLKVLLAKRFHSVLPHIIINLKK